jgi:ABC-type sulfate/molybdate transport systems ATPase subunit
MGSFVLGADFEVKAGERAALTGRSGAGKTLLLRLIAGLDSCDGGKIFLGGADITGAPAQDRRIGYVFQEQALFPSMSVLDNAVFGLRIRGVGKEQRQAEGLSWLERVGLRSLASASVTQLSGGERQRIAFVRALIWRPRLLLLDEPFTALDRSLREELGRHLLQLHELHPVPLLLVSHDQDDVAKLANVQLRLNETEGSSKRSIVRA